MLQSSEALKYMIIVKIYSRTRYNNRTAKASAKPYKKLMRFINK